MYRIVLCLFTSLYCEVFNDSICGLKAIKLQLRDNKPSARVNKLRAHRVWHAELTLDFDQRRCWEGDDFFNTVVCQKVPFLFSKRTSQQRLLLRQGWNSPNIFPSSFQLDVHYENLPGFPENCFISYERPQTLNIDFKCQNMCWCVYIYSQNRYIRRNYKLLVMKKN